MTPEDDIRLIEESISKRFGDANDGATEVPPDRGYLFGRHLDGDNRRNLSILASCPIGLCWCAMIEIMGVFDRFWNKANVWRYLVAGAIPNRSN
jgi:hypothetical protein